MIRFVVGLLFGWFGLALWTTYSAIDREAREAAERETSRLVIEWFSVVRGDFLNEQLAKGNAPTIPPTPDLSDAPSPGYGTVWHRGVPRRLSQPI